MAFRIMLAGGGSGGHVYPLVAIAQEIKRLAPQYHAHVRMRFIGDGALMAHTAKELGISYRQVVAPKWRRYGSLLNILDLFKIPLALLQSFLYVWTYMPDVMLVKGGYAAFFPALAARMMFIPLVVHESDSIPGKTNLYWGRHARRVFLSFEHAKKFFAADRVELVGQPIRSELLNLPPKQKRDKPVLFVTGGSQGSQTINEAIDMMKSDLEKTYAVVHQRDGSWDVSQMAQAYADADVIISRAGSAVFEIAAAGKPVILIPLEGSAQNHQLTNAEEFAGHGAIIVPQANLQPHILLNQINHAYEQREQLGKMLKSFVRPDAATIIAKELLTAR